MPEAGEWTALAEITPSPGALAAAAHLIQAASAAYSGVYLYGLEGDTLVLRAHVGRDTDHIEIPVGEGVCGRAVSEDTDQIVDDVTADANYIACSIETRSEIVVLSRREGRVVGQIDIDSDLPAAFSEHDRERLQLAAEIIAPLF